MKGKHKKHQLAIGDRESEMPPCLSATLRIIITPEPDGTFLLRREYLAGCDWMVTNDWGVVERKVKDWCARTLTVQREGADAVDVEITHRSAEVSHVITVVNGGLVGTIIGSSGSLIISR